MRTINKVHPLQLHFGSPAAAAGGGWGGGGGGFEMRTREDCVMGVLLYSSFHTQAISASSGEWSQFGWVGEGWMGEGEWRGGSTLHVNPQVPVDHVDM